MGVSKKIADKTYVQDESGNWYEAESPVQKESLTTKVIDGIQYHKDENGDWYEGESIKKKGIGQVSKIGGQEQKPDGAPPTPSLLPSKSQKEAEKPSWQTSALNPLVGIKQAEERKAKEPIKFGKETPPVNVDNIKKYESSQQRYNLADKNRANISSQDEHSIFSPIPLIEDIGSALIPGYAESKKSKKYQQVTQAEQELEASRKDAMSSQNAIKEEIPKILSPISDKWYDFISYTVDRVPKLDEYKIRDFANKTARQYGVQEDGMFYNLIKRETSNLVTQKLIQPAVDEQLRKNYKKTYGRELDADLQSENNQAAIKLEEIKTNAKSSVNKLQNQISLEARDKVASIQSGITNQINVLNNEIKSAAEGINSKYSSLIKDGKFIGSKEEYAQYQQDFNAIQEKEKQNKELFASLNKKFLDEQNLIFTKANARYRREAEEVAKIAQSQYEKFKPKANPQLQKNIEKLYSQSYDEVLRKNEDLRRTMASFNTPMDNFAYNIASSFGGWLKGAGESAGLEGVVTFGDFLQNSYAQNSTELKSVKDLLDFQKLAQWSGQIIGGMLPGMAGAAAVTAATGGSGAPVGLQMIAAGATQWAAETYSNAGNIKADVLAATGDIAKANNAERETIAFQKDILPLYSFSGLPFIGKPVSRLISKYVPSAVRATSPTILKLAGIAEKKWAAPIIAGALEFGEELPQEYSQNLSEEAIRKEGSYANMFDYHTKEKLQNTALNIAPMFLFGGVGELMGQSEETKKQYAMQQAAKSFALKTDFANLAPGQKQQFLFDVIQRQGAPFAAAYLTANYSSGQINKATFEEMQQTYAKQVDLLGKTEELGLTPVQAKLYNAFSTYHDNEKQRFDETDDPIIKTIASARMAEYQNALTNIALKKEPNYSVVTYPDNTQMVFMHSELENALKQPAFAKAVANGDIKVGVFGESEKLNTQIEETKKSVVAAQKEEQKVAKEEEANTRKEIEAEFNVEIEDNIDGMGVEVKGLGTEEQTQQAKQALRNAGIKLREDDTENVTGLPSQVGEGQELVTTEPQQGAGTEATSTGGVLQTQGVGGQVQGVGQKILTPISVSNKTELTGLEQRTSSDKNKSAVLASAKKAIATLKSVFPDMDIFIHEDGDAYNKTMEQLEGTQNSRGNFAFERDKNKNPTGRGRIDINLSNASETTVAHEVTHAVLLKAFGDSPATFKQFRDRISPILRADLNEELLKFEEMYAGKEVAPEEYLTQLSAFLSKGAETVEYKPSTLRKIAAVINEFVAKITNGKFQPFKGEVDFKNFVDFLNQMSQAIEKGDVIKNLNTQEAYSSGESIPVSNPKDFVAKKIGETKSKAEIGDYQFPDDIEALKIANLPIKNLTDLVRQYEGRVVIITSDATGYGVDGMGQPIFGGFGFSANAKNVNDGIGFASVSIGTVKGTYTAAEKAYGLGKSLVLVMVQPPHTTINNSYGAKYMIRGMKEIAGQSKEELAKTKEAIKDFIKNSTAIQNELKGNEASLKRGSEKRLIELIDGIDENTDLDAAVEEFLADTTFTIRKELGKGIILENKDIRTNKSTNYAKIALNNAGYNIYSFLKEYGDNTILNDDLILNNTGGYVVGGFELDILPTEEREKLISDIQSKGIVHPLFNAKLPGTNHFRLDGLYDVQENFSEYVRPETVITLDQKERDKLVRKYYKEDKYYNAQYRSIPLNKRTYTQLTIPAKTEFKEKYLRKKGALVETVPNIATKVAKGEGFITKPGAAEQMAKATYKSKAQLPEQVEATAKALEDVGKEARETIRYNYEDSFGFNDFDWNEESKRENFREWLKDFEKKQFNKNLPKVIKEVKEDIELLKEKELSHAKLKDFEDLIIPSLGNEALVPILSKFEEDVLLDPYLTLEQMEKGFKEAKNIIDEDGSLNMRKIETGEILNKEKRISLPGFERFVENNPDYKGVFDAWKKIFDKDIELTLKETNAYRYPSIKELENLYKDLTKSEAPTTIASKSQLPKQEGVGVGVREVEGRKPIGDGKYVKYNPDDVLPLLPNYKPTNTLAVEDYVNQTIPNDASVEAYKTVPLDAIQTSEKIESKDRKVIDKIKEGIKNGDDIPPLVLDFASVILNGEGYKFGLMDGHHRYIAYKELGIKEVPAAIVTSRENYEYETNDTNVKTLFDQYQPTQEVKSQLPKQEQEGVGEDKTEGGGIKSKSEVEAYHGSPYDFEKFTTEKIGTGEGAQAFGYGLYFTDLKGIAKGYADAISTSKTTGGREGYYSEKEFDEYLSSLTNDENIKKWAKSLTSQVFPKLNDTYYHILHKDKNGRTFIDIVNDLYTNPKLMNLSNDKFEDIIGINKDSFYKFAKNFERYVYKVSIHEGKTPDQYTFLEWDKPFKKNIPEKVVDQFIKEGLIDKSDRSYSIDEYMSKDGATLYKKISQELGGDKAASEFLLRAGIDGIKYPAESISRGATSENARGFNYVVFDEGAVTIKSKSEKTKVDFGEGEEGKDNKKEFDKLTSTIPNSGEVTKYLSGETIEKYEGEKPRNEQEVIAQQLRPALERGVDIIEKAKELFGEEYVEKLLQYVETENLPPANKALIYVSLENEVAKQKLENPSEAAKISKMQDLVRAKSQAFLRSNSLAINMGRLRKFAEVGYDVNRLTDRFFSSRELEDKKKIEDALQATADDINKEAAQQLQDEIDNKEKVENNDEEGIAKIFEQLPEKKKTVIKKAISSIDRMMGRFSAKMSSRYKSRSDLNTILENGTKKIKNALRAGIKIEDAVEIGIESMKKEHEKEYSQKWADEDTFRRNITQELNAAGLLTPIPKLFTINALIEKGYGKEINVKTKNGIEKRTILDWKKLAGEEGSVDKIKEKVESVLKDRGYTDAEISQMQQDFIDEYNDLRQSIVEKSLNEINARNKQATTPEQKSAVRKLVEMYNYGLFDKDPNAYELALAKTVGLKGLSLENFIKVKELGDVMSNLFNSNFEGKPLNESQLRSAIQVIEEKMRVILNSEAIQQGGTAFKLSEIVKEYMDASQRMMLNTVKQGIENPISGLLERFYSSIGYAGTIPEQLNAQQRKMARDIYKEMVLQKGMGYGNVGNAFISKGSLDAHIHNMSDSELVQGIMSVAMGKTILDAVDSAYKSKITQQKFTYNLIKILTKDRMVNGKLEKGMSKEEAKRYVAEKISGQSFEDAKQTAKNIIDKINTDAGKKIFNDSPEFVSRLATDIVNAALVNGEKITEEMVTAAYNAAYRAAGRGLGHVANNPISEQINTVSGKLESRISDAVKQKKFAKATYLNLYSIFYRNIANPFVGGGTNWIVLKAEKTGLGLISGLISMYKDRGAKMDLMTDTGMKELEDVMFNSMKTKDKFMRGAVGGAVTVLAFMLIKATGADDEYEKWIKKNQWAKKYLTILTPEIMLAMLAAKEERAYKKYLEATLNQSESFDKGKMALKVIYSKDKATAAGVLLNSSIGNPIPWRLVRDGQQIWVGATGGEPYSVNPIAPKTFVEGFLKGGMFDYMGLAPTSEDKSTIVSAEELDSPAYKVYKEKEIKMPKVGDRTSYEIPASIRESKQMTEEEFNKFSKSVKEYELNGWVEVDKITRRKTEYHGLKELLDSKWKIKIRGKMPRTVLGRDLPKEDLQNKVNQLHSDAVKKAKEDLGFIEDKKEKRKVTQFKY